MGQRYLGRNWLSSLVLDWNALLNIRQCANIKNTTNKIDVEPNKLDEILHEYREVFDKSIGTLKNTIVHINLKENAEPKYCKARPVPYAIKDRLDKDKTR